MWFATDRGIVRFDGQNFLNINTEQNFTSCVFNFFEENKHKIWVSTGNNELFWFNPSDNTFEMHPYIFNTSLVESIEQKFKTSVIRNIVFNGNDCKITFLKQSGIIKIKNGIATRQNIHYLKESHNHSNLTINIETDFIYSMFENNVVSKGQLYITYKNKKTMIDPTFSYSLNAIYGISSTAKYKDELFISIGNYLIKIKDSKIYFKKLPFEILKINVAAGNLFIGTFKGAYQLNSNLEIINSFLDNFTITDIQKDFDDGYWFSTTDNGIYYTSNIKILKLKHSEKIIPSYSFTKNNKLFFLHKNEELYIYSKVGNLITILPKISERYDLLSSTNKKLEKHLEKPILFSNYLNRFFFRTNNTRQYRFKTKSTIYLDKKNKTFITPLINNQKEYNERILINDTTLIIRINNKAYLYNLAKKKYTELVIPNKKLTSLHQIKETILISCENEIYTYKNKSLKLLNTKTNFSKIHIQNDSIFWVYDYNGLNKILYKDSILKSESITVENGLNTNEIISLTSDKENLWIGSKKGIIRIGINYIPKQNQLKKERFIIDSVSVNEQNKNIQAEIKMGEESTLVFYYKYIQFSNSNPIELEYQINNSHWLSCNSNHLTLQNLNKGIQTLKIRKKNNKDQYLLFETNIEITPIFYNNVWFSVLTLLTSTIFIYFIILQYFKFKNRKKETEIQILQLELKLLTSQMNPHFTFNTINSIQHYILKNEKKEAIQYLSDFALLMRKTLDFSMNDQVSLKEELDYIELYITLENKRFDKYFTFEKQIQSSINLESNKIPSLLIQPLIENIILHANYTEQQVKRIIVSIIKNKNYYLIEIIDFGVGISKNNNLEKHKSYGIDILKNRLKIYNGKNYYPTDIQFKFTDQINKVGTSVILKLYTNESDHN